MEKVHLRQDVSLGNEQPLPLQSILTVSYFQVFMLCEMTANQAQHKANCPWSYQNCYFCTVLCSAITSMLFWIFSCLCWCCCLLTETHQKTCQVPFFPCSKGTCASHADPFLAHLTHKGQTLFLVLPSLCIVSAPFTALGRQALGQGSTQSSVSSGGEGFALQIISPGRTQPQGRHVLKSRGTTMKFPSFPGWKLQAARADVRGSKALEMPRVQAV